MKRHNPVFTRRGALAGLGTLLLAGFAGPALAAVSVQLVTSKSGGSTKLYVKVSGNVPGVSIPATTLGPLYVKPDGKKVTRKYSVLGVSITVVAVVVGTVLTVITFGALGGGAELFRRTVQKTIPA